MPETDLTPSCACDRDTFTATHDPDTPGFIFWSLITLVGSAIVMMAGTTYVMMVLRADPVLTDDAIGRFALFGVVMATIGVLIRRALRRRWVHAFRAWNRNNPAAGTDASSTSATEKSARPVVGR
jgi:ABC-type multidrug transport system fused ATPase/permease subunit